MFKRAGELGFYEKITTTKKQEKENKKAA